jgi:pyruvate dehydrogenase E2 component (dihydrolipoamide acetyltransferase)
MAERIIMPKQGLQMTEGTILEWLVSEGSAVVEGQPLFRMETDKLTITIDAPVSGTLLKILKDEGETVPITETIAIVGEPGEDVSAMLSEEEAPVPIPDISVAPGRPVKALAEDVDGGLGQRRFITPRARMRAKELRVDFASLVGSAPDRTIIERDILQASALPRATPLARKVAEMTGISLDEVTGTGARGKIIRQDVVNASVGKVVPEVEEARVIIPMRGMRKVIAERMKDSLNTAAQASHRISVRMDRVMEIRKALNKAIGYNDIIAFATIRALLDYPEMNAELTQEGIWQKNFVNLGVAVALEDGLIVPVVRSAEKMKLGTLSEEIATLVKKAQKGQLLPEEYIGGTFTLSNLGMFGLDEFEAIINPPEAGILAVGRIMDTPVANNGCVDVLPIMKLTLSYDHRLVDGAPAARFLVRVKEYLESPYKLL